MSGGFAVVELAQVVPPSLETSYWSCWIDVPAGNGPKGAYENERPALVRVTAVRFGTGTAGSRPSAAATVAEPTSPTLVRIDNAATNASSTAPRPERRPFTEPS